VRFMPYLVALTDIAVIYVLLRHVIWKGFKDYQEDCRRG